MRCRLGALFHCFVGTRSKPAFWCIERASCSAALLTTFLPDRASDITLGAMILETLPAVQQLSAGDKLRLWEELWEQVAADESR